MASGEMSEAEFITFLRQVLCSLSAHSQEGAIHFICMDWRHLFELLTAGRSVYNEVENLVRMDEDKWGHGIAVPFTT